MDEHSEDEVIRDDRYLSGEVIPDHLRGPVLVAREVWRQFYPGVGLDGSAETIVTILDRYYQLKRRSRPRRNS
jgi:hypothetical protein